MDERGMKKEGKNRGGKGWGNFMFKENVIRNSKPR
jgi:hypothetical protein